MTISRTQLKKAIEAGIAKCDELTSEECSKLRLFAQTADSVLIGKPYDIEGHKCPLFGSGVTNQAFWDGEDGDVTDPRSLSEFWMVFDDYFDISEGVVRVQT